MLHEEEIYFFRLPWMARSDCLRHKGLAQFIFENHFRLAVRGRRKV